MPLPPQWAGYAGGGPEDNEDAFTGPHLLNDVLWTVSAGSPLSGAPSLLHSTPAIDWQGNLYFGSFDGFLRAVSPAGVTLWKYDAGGAILTSPALYGDILSIYIASEGQVVAVSILSGVQVWNNTLTSQGDNSGSPVVNNGTLYIALSSGTLAALSATDGSVLWSYSSTVSGNFPQFSPAVDEDGNVYVVDTGGNLYAFAPDGTSIYEGVNVANIASGVTYFDGNLYMGDNFGTLYQVSAATGSMNAQNIDCQSMFYNFYNKYYEYYSWQLGVDTNRGVLYGSCNGNGLFAVYASTMKSDWSAGTVTASSATLVGGDGTVYVVDYSGVLFALSPEGSILGSFATGIVSNSDVSSPVIGPSGSLYLAYDKLYAIGDGSPSPSPTPEADWAGYAGGGPEDNSETFVGPHLLNDLLWNVSTGSPLSGAPSLLHSTPAIDTDGNLYFGSFDGSLYAVNPAGATLWSYSVGAYIITSPAIHNGTVFFYSDDGNLTALSLAGDLVWSVVLAASGGSASSPVVDHGTLYIALCSPGKLLALSPSDGSELWSFSSSNFPGMSPAVDEIGNVYICDSDGYLYGLSPEGTQTINYYVGPASGLIYFQGILYAGTGNGAVLRVSLQYGAIEGNNGCGNDYSSDFPFQLGLDKERGLLYGSCYGEALYALDIDNMQVRWFLQTVTAASAAVVGGDGTVYVIDSYGTLYAVDSSHNILGSYSTQVATNGAVSSPVIGPTGAIYVTLDQLYAISDSP